MMVIMMGRFGEVWPYLQAGSAENEPRKSNVGAFDHFSFGKVIAQIALLETT